MEEKFKIVPFEKYCDKCEYKDLSEKDDPCWSCLDDPYTLNGIPREFKKKEKKR